MMVVLVSWQSLNYEEKQKRESQILQDFRSLISTKLGPQGGGQ